MKIYGWQHHIDHVINPAGGSNCIYDSPPEMIAFLEYCTHQIVVYLEKQGLELPIGDQDVYEGDKKYDVPEIIARINSWSPDLGDDGVLPERLAVVFNHGLGEGRYLMIINSVMNLMCI
jgi:hypothetical protein